jgi:hypothetical protein
MFIYQSWKICEQLDRLCSRSTSKSGRIISFCLWKCWSLPFVWFFLTIIVNTLLGKQNSWFIATTDIVHGAYMFYTWELPGNRLSLGDASNGFFPFKV